MAIYCNGAVADCRTYVYGYPRAAMPRKKADKDEEKNVMRVVLVRL